MISIRNATERDWASIWPIIQEVVAAGDTYALPADLSEDDAREMWLEMPPGCTVVAVDDVDGTVLGSAHMGPNRPGAGAHVGTASFMVGSAARGRGVGRLLGEYVVQWLRDAGFDSIQFNAVVESNTVAVRLWKSLGFQVIGTVPAAFRHPQDGLVGLHVMYLKL
ncbi:N-acetyltransferase [Flexivirga endophytica]|uniref:N-acetyltransferase n=1 Tax=Flexivirga endophytica TaxID=1849103 RepID=A0A916SX29_9MICO|nr:GNAT family N-acetyltransferase [Flexivirga endophytica]GGB20891.1 N-acetyltransferase [Flexivirga endophytica]GHB58705.1 N-acetyltransferase [Flexivirga endophytica]